MPASVFTFTLQFVFDGLLALGDTKALVISVDDGGSVVAAGLAVPIPFSSQMMFSETCTIAVQTAIVNLGNPKGKIHYLSIGEGERCYECMHICMYQGR